MAKSLLLIIFLVFSVYCAVSEDDIVQKIVYKNVIISYEQQILITIFFNEQTITDVIVFLNETEIANVKKFFSNTNSEPFFLPSINFYVNKVQQENNLKVFIKYGSGNSRIYKDKLFFNKGLIADYENIEIHANKIFFVKAGVIDPNGIYNLYIEDKEILSLLEEINFDNVQYYRVKTLKIGSSRVIIYKIDTMTDNKFSTGVPSKMITVNVY